MILTIITTRQKLSSKYSVTDTELSTLYIIPQQPSQQSVLEKPRHSVGISNLPKVPS